MSVLTTPPPKSRPRTNRATTMPPRYRPDSLPEFMTVEEYDRLIDQGVLTKYDRCELIEGRVVEKVPIGDEHTSWVIWLNKLLNRKYLDLAVVSVQNPIRSTTSEPEPDIVLVPDPGPRRLPGKPRPKDILLVIEIADSSLEYDLGPKAEMYARAGIREYWVLDVIGAELWIHRSPQADGSWGEARIAAAEEVFQLAGLEGVSISVSELFPSE